MQTESLILKCPSITELEGTIQAELFTRLLRKEEVKRILELAQAVWIYEGNPCKERPHALLHSGKHSNGYADVGSVLKTYPNIRKLLAHSLALMVVRDNAKFPFSINWVVGADTSSTLLAGDVADFFGIQHIQMKKNDEGGIKKQVWDSAKNSSIDSTPSTGLQVEELITTASSALEVRKGIAEKVDPLGRTFLFHRIVPTIVDRSSPKSSITAIDGSIVHSLLRLYIENYEPGPATCPYCDAGSEAIKPKGENWARLTAK
jgi:orotate phosphoribosyltransferase